MTTSISNLDLTYVTIRDRLVSLRGEGIPAVESLARDLAHELVERGIIDDPQPIEFAEIRAGDRARHTMNDGVVTEFVVARTQRGGITDPRGSEWGQHGSWFLISRPAPIEPTGLGAVVEDRNGDFWVQVTSPPQINWRSEQGVWKRWDLLVQSRGPLTIRSEGYPS